ncbi:hypothetical protein FACS1894189_4420 [Planctomycetales bacterium]|nr:hypothetical protein FACS1894189_4420 [Planctomycetales bacterium]
MLMADNPTSTNRSDTEKPLYYTAWMVSDQKWSVAVLLFLIGLVCFVVWQLGSSLWGISAGMMLLLLPIWYVFVPVHFELNTNGIVREIFGHKWFIAWEDIRGYQIRHNGLLLLSQNDRFLLESFLSFYLPVPSALMPEVLYRFRVFVDLSE